MPRPAPAPPAPAPIPGSPQWQTAVVDGLKSLYQKAVKPLEAAYRFEAFHSSSLSDADIEAKPMVLLFGTYSVGKTTIINYLCETQYAGCSVGNEPTTDRFVALMHGDQPRVIPGNAVAVLDNKPFQGLKTFGMAFLNRFECVEMNSPLLRNITLIDTPGILAGEKQRIGRQYNFAEVVRYFAQKADRIFLVFDAYKLDISDEFKSAIECVQGNEDKVRCILNKSDSVNSQALLRCYGALMWSLARVIKTPEVFRVYLCSLWNEPLKNTENATLLKAEEAELLSDLKSLPRHSVVRKINEVIKRARQVRIHALLVGHLRSKLGIFGKDKTQQKLLDMPKLMDELGQVVKQHGLPHGDLPNIHKFRDILAQFELAKFPKLDMKMIEAVDHALNTEIPHLMKFLPSEDSSLNYREAPPRPAHTPSFSSPSTPSNTGVAAPAAIPASSSGATPFDDVPEYDESNPFDDDPNASSPADLWGIPQASQTEYTNQFFQLHLSSDKLSGSSARDVLMKLGVQKQDLRQIWSLSDIDKDGSLDLDEYILVSYLIDIRKRNGTMYDVLPSELVPPSKR